MNIVEIRRIHGDAVADEIERVQTNERAKALEKYGKDALQPGGRPEFDILDFVIGEAIGLDRYGEMMLHRFEDDPELCRLGTFLRGFSSMISPRLIQRRLSLLALGKQLGVEEHERFTLPDNAEMRRRKTDNE